MTTIFDHSAPAGRAAWLAERRKYVTASDIASVLGQSPYRSPADVLAEKTMDLTESDAGEAAEIGLELEPALIAWCARTVGLSAIDRNVWEVAPNNVMAATLDARSGPIGIEAKTAGVLNYAAVGDDWGEAGTDHIPVQYLLQVAGQFIAAPGMERVYVAALLAGRGRALYHVDRDAPEMRDLIVEVEIRCTAWWKSHVVDRVPLVPDAAPPALETLRRIRRQPSLVLDLTAEEPATAIVKAWRAAEDAKSAAVTAADVAKARALALLGDAEAARVLVGGETKLLKFMVEPRKGYVVEPSEPRVARLVKLPKGGL